MTMEYRWHKSWMFMHGRCIMGSLLVDIRVSCLYIPFFTLDLISCEDELLPHTERPSGDVATAGSNLLEIDVSH